MARYLLIALAAASLLLAASACRQQSTKAAPAQDNPIRLAPPTTRPAASFAAGASALAHPAELPATVSPAFQSRKPRVIAMEVTAYCACKTCCGKGAKGLTASGKRITHNGGAFVAADTSVLPFFTRLSIPGYADGKPVPVIDRGSAIVGNRLDVYFSAHKQAQNWGRRKLLVTIVE